MRDSMLKLFKDRFHLILIDTSLRGMHPNVRHWDQCCSQQPARDGDCGGHYGFFQGLNDHMERVAQAGTQYFDSFSETIIIVVLKSIEKVHQMRHGWHPVSAISPYAMRKFPFCHQSFSVLYQGFLEIGV